MRKVSTALLVDDDPAFRRALQGSLRRRAVKAATAATVEEGIIAATDEPFDLIVVDYRMPETDGLVALPRLRRIRPDAVIIMLTGYGDIPLTVEAMRLGADSLMTKPIDADRLLRDVNLIRERYGAGVSGAQRAPESARTYRLEDMERETIEAALKDSGGVVSEAARRLGIDRRTLQRKLKRQ